MLFPVQRLLVAHKESQTLFSGARRPCPAHLCLLHNLHPLLQMGHSRADLFLTPEHNYVGSYLHVFTRLPHPAISTDVFLS